MESTKKYVCDICNKTFTRKNNLKNHNNVKHELDNLEMKIKLYSDQINFLKQLVIIQDHALRRERVDFQVKTNTITNNPNPISHEQVTDNGKY